MRQQKPAAATPASGRAGLSKIEEEDWRPGLDLNQDGERCTALAWTFRHRADRVIADHGVVTNAYRRLTLIGGVGRQREGVARHESYSPRIVADIDGRALGAQAGFRELGDHVPFAVALQAEAGA